ncbi:hypothetical protein IV203_035915 [Nitzschia inconspicua]|uniref:Uncharacterized protein n=1 Tax=Nitzschia inconspicua TaxID=303405 RepID=A0A9K3LH33_9STRA|nr:hypothetical protein IV203_035915 [Nitzschia inconspicua]
MMASCENVFQRRGSIVGESIMIEPIAMVKQSMEGHVTMTPPHSSQTSRHKRPPGRKSSLKIQWPPPKPRSMSEGLSLVANASNNLFDISLIPAIVTS